MPCGEAPDLTAEEQNVSGPGEARLYCAQKQGPAPNRVLSGIVAPCLASSKRKPPATSPRRESRRSDGVNLGDSRMPSDESQLADGRELELFRLVSAEDSYDIARDQGALACCVLC